jgi:hypothetical protein
MKRKWIGIVLAILVISSLVGTGIVIGQGETTKALPTKADKTPPPNNTLSSVSFTPITKIAVSGAKELTEYDGYKLEYGLWYDEYTRIYSIGGKFRVVEISNYPRVYRDTVSHVYDKDITFTVVEADLNYYDEKGARWYQDSQQKLWKLGEKATHFIGEGLPGEFPSWLEYTTLQMVKSGFNIDKLVSDIYFKSGVLLSESGVMTNLSGKEVNAMASTLNSKSISIAIGKVSDRQLLYIFLVRQLYDGN